MLGHGDHLGLSGRDRKETKGMIMSALTWPNPFLDQLADEHRKWLSAFDPQYLNNWEKLLNADDEAAMAEARFRSILEDYGVRVKPNEDLAGAGQCPDFKCSKGADIFYTEVTCISNETATAKTGIPNESHGPTDCRPLNDVIFAKCREKASQCADLDGPALLAIGTFHTNAAMLSFDRPIVDWILTGEPKISWKIDPKIGKPVENISQVTELHSAAFLRPDDTEGVGFARSSLSALLLCGLGSNPPMLIGVLHPNPVRSFDPSVLSGVEFGQVKIDQTSGWLHVGWPEGTEK